MIPVLKIRLVAASTITFGLGLGMASPAWADATPECNLGSGTDSTECGADSEASGPDSTAVGDDARATGRFGTATGRLSKALDANATAIGYGAQGSAADTTALGAAATASAGAGTAIGSNALANGTFGTAVGYFSRAARNSATALGTGSTADGDAATALGVSSQANGQNSVAIGVGSRAAADNSVAIGARSRATEANTVSVGDVGAERRIVNVAAGTGATDAVNLAQMVEANSAQDARIDSIDRLSITNSSRLTALEGNLGALSVQSELYNRQASGGIAAAMAMSGTIIPADASGAISFNLSTYRGQQGFSGVIVQRIAPKVYANIGVAGSTVKGSTGGRVGVTIGW